MTLFLMAWGKALGYDILMHECVSELYSGYSSFIQDIVVVIERVMQFISYFEAKTERSNWHSKLEL